MNTRYLFIGALGFCGFLIIGLAFLPMYLFGNQQSPSPKKQILQKSAEHNEAAGQASPSSFGNEIEFETNNGVVYVYVNNRLAGPLQVQLSAGSSTRNMDASPSLPIM